MRVFLRSLAAFGAMCAATQVSADDHPYGAPGSLPAPTEAAAPEAPADEPGDELAPVTSGNAWDGGAENYDDAGDCSNGDCGNGDCGGNSCCSTCGGCGYGCCGYGGCGDCCCNPWFGTVAVLAMDRDNADHQFTTYDATNINDQLVSFRHAETDMEAGFEVRFGRRFCCCWGLEATYWSLSEFSGDANYYSATDEISSTFDWGTLNFNGVLVEEIFDNAREHRISRHNDFQNFELNLISMPMANPCDCLTVNWFAGARYFRFDEDLTFSSVAGGFEFGQDLSQEGHYAIDVENNLIGFQVGGQATFCLGHGFGLYANQRAGVFYNDIDSSTNLYSGDGFSATSVSGSKEDLALIGQLELGVNCQISCRVSAFVGYRVLGVAGIAQADRQVPQFIEDTPGIADIDSSSQLILHGAVAGLTFTF